MCRVVESLELREVGFKGFKGFKSSRVICHKR